MTNLHRVRPGRFLSYPDDGIKNANVCGPGDVIDLADAFMAFVCARQLNKLEPAPEGAVATDLSKDRALAGLRARYALDHGAPPVPSVPPPRVAQAVEVARVDGTTAAIPRPDARPIAKPKPSTVGAGTPTLPMS